MTLKFCQGPKCHTYHTQDRLKGMKGSKTYQTRRRSGFYYGNGNFCDQRCMYNWFQQFGDQAVNHFGRITEVKHLTEDNAWYKSYDYRGYRGEEDTYHFVNSITEEQRPLTKAQYDDTNYTINTGE